MPDNNTFLQALFGEDAPFVHVTDFSYDPGNIPGNRHLAAWAGDWFSRYVMRQQTNQYFCISIFTPNDDGKARRRKALFLRTRVIVLDDVREKLSLEAAGRLPPPSWVLETSKGSEQWGYILDTPCHDRARVENLLDGLVANGLAPDGKDPGMKGVTRYVRLPEGVNTKASKLVDGWLPFKCRMVSWNPERRVTMEQLAQPFAVNLDAPRREARLDGAASVPDHPLLHIPDLIHIKETRSDGRFDITCPWVDEHTGEVDNGTAVFTNDDGTVGFKCHHGACQHRTARDLVRWVEQQQPGFGQVLSSWRVERVFKDLVKPTPVPDFMGTPTQVVQQVAAPSPGRTMDDLFDQLKRERHTSNEARQLAESILRLCEELPVMERKARHDEVRDLMHWGSKKDFDHILKELRAEWYNSAVGGASFLENFVYVKEQDRFYDYSTGIFYTPAAFQNSHSDIDLKAKENALSGGQMTKVDKLDFAPREGRTFMRRGITYGNTWSAGKLPQGSPGNCDWWLDHWEKIGWTRYRDHHLKWMAYTLRHPEHKINHMLLLGGQEGIGKDYLLYPLIVALGDYSKTIDGNELIGSFNEYLLNTKLLHINETELGDHAQSKTISSKLKPLAAQPPLTLRVNQKGISTISVSNIVNCVMTTNDRLPFRLSSTSRRFHAAWSTVSVRDSDDNMIQAWKDYWALRWKWMEENVEACIYYLQHIVDLSDFNPGEAPPMTEFLRDIRESSKSPAVQTIEAFILHRIGAFASDLVTSADIASTLRSADMKHGDLLNVDSSFFTVARVGRLMSEICNAPCFKVGGEGKNIRLWAIRDSAKYQAYTMNELFVHYTNEMKRIRGQTVTDRSHIQLATAK